jgi:N6-L-threonylcarbamoyladenine synthase
MLILGIESSCDDTSVAIVRDGREVLSNILLSQADIHAKYGGVVPEIASRAHTEAIYSLCEDAIKQINIKNIDAVAATYAPGLIGALLVGVNFGKALAYKLNVPFIPVNHIKGHVAAAYLENPELEPPFLAFIASGGHTSIMELNSYTDFKLLGMTRDDAIGEAFDKTARAMGFDYPGGAHIERCANINFSNLGDKNGVKIPLAKVEGSELDFSFSGIKTHIINYINTLKQKNGGLSEIDINNISASFTENVIKSVTSRLKRAIEITGHKTLVCAGGVMANGHIKDALKNLCGELKTKLYIPDKKYCGDNAAMIASQGFYEFQAGNTSGLNQNAYATVDWS